MPPHPSPSLCLAPSPTRQSRDVALPPEAHRQTQARQYHKARFFHARGLNAYMLLIPFRVGAGSVETAEAFVNEPDGPISEIDKDEMIGLVIGQKADVCVRVEEEARVVVAILVAVLAAVELGDNIGRGQGRSVGR